MYHRFHAPTACRVREVIYISGDTWNVNPIALRRVERLFCKNERAVLDLELGGRESLALVPVAAILVASIRLAFLAEPLTLEYRGPNRIACDSAFEKGDEMGYFEHGSTIIVFGTRGFELQPTIAEGATIRMGQPLLREL
jgi:phosphatidylserine decarboxylase